MCTLNIFQPDVFRKAALRLPLLAGIAVGLDRLAASAEPPAPTADADGTGDPLAPPTGIEERALAERVVASLAEATEQLRDHTSPVAAVAAQQTAIDHIDELLKRLREKASMSSAPSPDSSSSNSADGRARPQPGQTSEGDRKAAQASDRAAEGAASQAAELQQRRNLAQAVWGNFPPKIQEELQRTFSERFVPQYEDLIQRYYQALADAPANSK